MEIQQHVQPQKINHDCPICGQAVYHNPTYPHQVCNACIMVLHDDQGRPIVLFPSDYWLHQFEARYRYDDTIRHDHTEAYINGVQCKIIRGPGSTIIVEKI